MSSRYAVAPPPPAEPGKDPAVGAITRYVSELARWRMRRDHELRALDELTRAHEDRDDLEADLTSSMTLFHAIAQRHDLLLTTWGDGGGGDAADPELDDGQRGWVGQLVWGVLEMPDGDAQALALSLPDALRLSDAMASALRGRLGTDEDELPMTERLGRAREHLDLVRSHLADREGLPDGDGLDERLEEAEARLTALDGREDKEAVGDLALVVAEIAAIDHEVVTTRAAHVHETAGHEQAATERDHLVARGEAVRALAEKVLNAINPAPRLGIPDVEALGEIPDEGPALEAYVGNLERVARALEQAHSTYAAALAEYADLSDRAERLARTLAGCGAPTSVDLAGMLTATKECLQTQPADVRRASALIAAQEAYLDMLRPGS